MQTRILAKEVLFWHSLVQSIGIPEQEKLWDEYKGIAPLPQWSTTSPDKGHQGKKRQYG